MTDLENTFKIVLDNLNDLLDNSNNWNIESMKFGNSYNFTCNKFKIGYSKGLWLSLQILKNESDVIGHTLLFFTYDSDGILVYGSLYSLIPNSEYVDIISKKMMNLIDSKLTERCSTLENDLSNQLLNSICYNQPIDSDKIQSFSTASSKKSFWKKLWSKVRGDL